MFPHQPLIKGLELLDGLLCCSNGDDFYHALQKYVYRCNKAEYVRYNSKSSLALLSLKCYPPPLVLQRNIVTPLVLQHNTVTNMSHACRVTSSGGAGDLAWWPQSC
jgi:hypothetical protein